jgi:hypothetical protein
MVNWDAVGPILASVGIAALALAARIGSLGTKIDNLIDRVSRIEDTLDNQERAAGRRPIRRKDRE